MDIEKLLENIPDKREWKTTTSHKFKRDLYELFNELGLQDSKIVELGTHHGHTTRILSFLFNEVVTYDIIDEGFSKKLNQDRENITHRYQDIYEFPWWEECAGADVVFIDAVHKYEEAKKDIQNALKIEGVRYIIFDDYGMFPSVKNAVLESMNDAWPRFKPYKYIGEPPGSDCRPGKTLQDWEGLVCKVG